MKLSTILLAATGLAELACGAPSSGKLTTALRKRVSKLKFFGVNESGRHIHAVARVKLTVKEQAQNLVKRE